MASGTFGANMAEKDWPETKFALLCISIALPSRSRNSTTSEATDSRDSQQGVTVEMCVFVRSFVSFLVSAVSTVGHRAVNSYTAYCLAKT